MTEYCPLCDERWSGQRTCEMLCVTCGAVIQRLEPFEAARRWVESVEEMAESNT